MNEATQDPGIAQSDLRFLVDSNADGILVVDDNGTVLFANRASEGIFGRAPASLIGSPIGIPLVSGTTEITIHRPGGGHVDAEIRAVDTRWGDSTARLATIRDVSARKAAEEQTRHTTKMEAVGRLTAGIAHDFNNLLTVVLGNLELAQRCDSQEALPRILGNAMRGARRAALLTERLLAFARKKPLEPRALNVNGLVSRMSELLQRTLGEAIAVKTILSPDPWIVEVDPTELEAAILNLAVNARDAMSSGGDLLIETANVELDASYAAINSEVEPGRYVLISVSDTGTGMAPDVLNQVFEPFFTTKPDGHGTGLGLSQVYGFVKQSGGHVKLYSEPGIGTTARIYLPRTPETELVSQEPDASGRDSLPGARAGETILVVEDDADVRDYTVTSLRELGYTVVEASDASSGLRLLESAPGIALLLTDLGLPGGMDGRTLADQARRTRSGLKVLITTAYAGNALIHEGRLDRGVELLTKPFTLSSLAGRVRELLDRDGWCDGRPAHILVVDDEVLLRMLVVETLTKDGCIAEEAGTVRDALAKFRFDPARFDAAIIDIGLPDRPGDELVAELRALRPHMPVILASGFADEDVRMRFAEDRRLALLAKPFDPGRLTAALRGFGIVGSR